MWIRGVAAGKYKGLLANGNGTDIGVLLWGQ
jgi:hypothetical protein